MAADATRSVTPFHPSDYERFRFLDRTLDERGRVTLRYALDDAITFAEELEVPVPPALTAADLQGADGLLSLLHWVAGVSYFKSAVPAVVEYEGAAPLPAT